MNPRFPVYIPSKGRWQSRMTARALERMKVPYHIIVEEQEFDKYAAVINPKKILILDPVYQRNFDPCDEFGDTMILGPGPVRNFAWDHAISKGFPWHWTMDDNIGSFSRLTSQGAIQIADGTGFRCMEDFVLRYKNIAMAGPNYDYYPGFQRYPILVNTRIYSCQLIRCDTGFRWRSRYNDDTDLSLRMLKAGWCTVSFNTFLQGKTATLKMKGGNAEIYGTGTDEFDKFKLKKAQVLVSLHPDVTRVARRFGRWHHYVDYSGFKHKLILRNGVKRKRGADEYGMRLVKVA